MTFTRYGVYYAPPADAEWVRFATNWLGWDMQTGRSCELAQLADLPIPLAEITDAPRKYGLHATLKPPFRLTPGIVQDDLVAACAGLADQFAPIPLGKWHLTRLGRFLALCPPASAAIAELAAACLRNLEPFRAPLTPAELQARRAARLTPRQEENLRQWGYPHVMDDFRFHLTLTGRLKKPDLNRVQSVLESQLVPLLPTQANLVDLALVGEDARGRFHLIQRFELSGLPPAV